MALVGRYYEMVFKNADKNSSGVLVPITITTRIYDMTLEGDDTIGWDIINIEGSGDPLHLSTVDNSEDKFTGIKPIQATIKFLSSNKVKLSSFVNAPIDPEGTDIGDPRWKVEIFYGTYGAQNFIFKGFLNIDDCSEAFLPEKNEVTLVANDGLGGLKNIALIKPDGTNPTGYNRISDYLAWALQKTGLNLNLNAVFNIRENNASTQHFFDSMFLQAKTFEDKIGVSINCYDVIEKILGEEAFLTQRAGEWWIMRVDEIGNTSGYYKAIFDSDGNFVSIGSEKFYIKTVEKDTADIYFSQEATTVHPVRPSGYIKETYRIEYAQEIVDNEDLSRGDLYFPLSMSDETVDGVTYHIGKYHVDDWTLYSPNNTGILGVAYIKKFFSDINKTYEKNRYLVIDANSPSPTQNWLKSKPIPINQSDKFSLGFDVKFRDDVTGSGTFWVNCGTVVLEGDDGSVWVCGTNGTDPTQKDQWVSVNINVPGTIQGSGRGAWLYQQKTDNQTQWSSLSLTSPPAPVSGNLYIILQASNYLTNQIHFSNIQFTYSPYVNGDYSKYTGQSYKISKPENYINKREKQVYVSDSFGKLFKGALTRNGTWVTFFSSAATFNVTDNTITVSTGTEKIRTLIVVGGQIKLSGTSNNNSVFTVSSITISGANTIIHVAETLNSEAGTPTTTFQKLRYLLASEFFAWNDLQTTSPSSTYVHPYGHIQAYDVWNQFRNGHNKFQATLQGLSNSIVDESGYVNPPHLIHRYYLQDINEHTNDRYFMLLTFDMDFYSCEWRGTLVEVYNTVNGKSYLDNLENKYEQ